MARGKPEPLEIREEQKRASNAESLLSRSSASAACLTEFLDFRCRKMSGSD